LIAEVLSPSTEARDRGSKFAQYRRLDSLQEYLLISTEQVSVDLFRRNLEGLWILHPFGAGDTVTLEAIDLSIPIATLYRQIDFADNSNDARI
jgi:Uma2 family endonuclease